ncbi:glucans biosynthesis protein [Ereboglobus sp. PH5-10]|uniref:glucan biosynthesis protein n=1 Tax=Ereboglobus sp. PH5-10 TaxID=2940629 RepID=UPI0024072759|nr:glucan biosynthesis protein G [Ereboglobus sp. PH5-10]MDF9826081.1 glucans biosynthesis protein [Ereboglobus sp. PH5-10]
MLLRAMRPVLCGVVVTTAASSAVAQDAFDFEKLRERAAALAAKPYVAPPSRVPEALRRLNYDEYRQIAYRADHALWARDDIPFRMQFFHPGFIQLHTVRINEVVDGRAARIPFSAEAFDYRGAARAAGSGLPADMGFSGLRVHNQLNKPGVWDDLVVFQGASYFRALAKGSHYGLSARGLAIDTAGPGGEEFPVFEEFWVERPVATAKGLRVWALMDSPSVTGAYQFLITPGGVTLIEVDAVIYRRAAKAEGRQVFGIAPLTSMFWFGKSSAMRPDDLRQEVHDSDGLSLHTGAGEWLWRPLDNPRAVSVSSFSDENPRGFGLMQRERDFENYQDIEAAYHLRPSVWVEPVGDWGGGEVRLVELPTPDETNDNIVAFWAPATLPPAGEPLRVSYRMHWFNEAGGNTPAPGTGIVVSTRQGRSFTHETNLRRFWVDYGGGALAKLSAGEKVEAVVTAGDGARVAHVSAERNPHNNTWRAAFAIAPDGSGKPVELRCFLRNNRGGALTETWSYLWNPETR